MKNPEHTPALDDMIFSPNEVRDYYDSWHDRYLDSFGNFFQSAQLEDHTAIINRILEAGQVKERMKILDAGCGVGGPAVGIAEKMDVHVTGITISKRQKEHGEELVRECGLEERVKILEGDFHDLSPFYNERFDLVYFLESLVHSFDPAKVFEEVGKVTKKGSVLLIKDLFKRVDVPEEELDRVIIAQRNTNKSCRLTIRYSKEIIDLARKAGFELMLFMDLDWVMNHDIGNNFVEKNRIEIYEGDPVKYLQWAELKFVKTIE